MIYKFLSVIALLSPGVDELFFERGPGYSANSNILLETFISEITEILPWAEMETLVIIEEIFFIPAYLW